MPALLSRPLRRETSPNSVPLAERDERGCEVEAESDPIPSRRTQRPVGIVCLVLALLLAGVGIAPLAATTFALAQVGRLAALATASDLAHRVLPSPEDTVSRQGTGATGTPGVPGKASDCTHGNRDALGENLVIDQQSWVCGDITVYAANISVLGRVDGDVRAIGGSVLVAGRVSGTVTSVGGDVDLQPGAQVGGDVQSLGGTVNQGSGALIHGNVSTGSDTLQSYNPRRVIDPYSAEIPWLQLLFWGLAGAALSLLFPQYVLRVRTMAQRQIAASFVSGVLVLVLGAIVALGLVITLIGIPLALFLVALLWVAWVVGNVSLGSWLGGSLLHLVSRERRSVVLSTVVGVLLLATLETLPYVGWPIFALAGFLGLGAAVRSYFATRRSRRALRRAGA